MPTDKSRADALTDDVLNKLIDLGAEAKGYHAKSMSDDGQAGTEAWEKWRDLRDQMRNILTASPVEQPAAALRERDDPEIVAAANRGYATGLADGKALGALAATNEIGAEGAIYQILTEEGAWLDTTSEYYERVMSDLALARVVYAAPQPPAPEGLTDEQLLMQLDDELRA